MEEEEARIHVGWLLSDMADLETLRTIHRNRMGPLRLHVHDELRLVRKRSERRGSWRSRALRSQMDAISDMIAEFKYHDCPVGVVLPGPAKRSGGDAQRHATPAGPDLRQHAAGPAVEDDGHTQPPGVMVAGLNWGGRRIPEWTMRTTKTVYAQLTWTWNSGGSM
jgi:hypothetical protein